MDFFSPIICLALNIYFEARGEPLEGQIAVSQVVMNRVHSPEFPNTICEVIKQPRHFSWYWDGKSDIPKESEPWRDAQILASFIYTGFFESDYTNGSLYYHAVWLDESVCNNHSHILNDNLVIGEHIFYKEQYGKY